MPFSASKIVLSLFASIRFLYSFTFIQCIIQHTRYPIIAKIPSTGIMVQSMKIFFVFPMRKVGFGSATGIFKRMHSARKDSAILFTTTNIHTRLNKGTSEAKPALEACACFQYLRLLKPFAGR